jgi:hypothetical protein
MMYSKNFAAAIKVNGKILREFGDTVYLPFGSEYEIRLKNLNSERAKVIIEIDGNNVTDNGLVLNPYQIVDLERFIKNGNLYSGNRFKFIERTEKIEDYRGIRLEDGLIVIKYCFEIPRPTYRSSPFIHNSVYLNSCSKSFSDSGITVEGSTSYQNFSTTTWGGSSQNANSLIIKLLGETEENKKIREPVTVKTKLECKTCGTLNPTSSKFCSECGTSLEIV